MKDREFWQRMRDAWMAEVQAVKAGPGQSDDEAERTFADRWQRAVMQKVRAVEKMLGLGTDSGVR